MRLGVLLILMLVGYCLQAQYNSLLWKITAPGSKGPSYIMGTMHTNHSKVLQLGRKCYPYIRRVQLFAMEADIESGMDIGLLQIMRMGSGYSLRQMLPADDYRLLDSLILAQMGLPLSLLDNVAPVFILTMLEAQEVAATEPGGNTTAQPLDLQLRSYAAKRKKKVVGVETLQEQFETLGTLTYEEQADMLLNYMHTQNQPGNSTADLLRFYLQQQLDSLLVMSADETMPEKFNRALLQDRNLRMAQRTAAMVQQQTVFVAVGALHLPGPEGVIEHLRKLGLTVEPLRLKGR